jgi:hypothetical protein
MVWSMMRLILRRSMPSSRAMARWLRPARRQSSTVCSVAGAPAGTGGCSVLHHGCRLAVMTRRGTCLCGVWFGSDEGHEEFEGSG